MSSEVPFVRIVVLSFDGGQMTLDCIESLVKTNWPRDRYEIVMVDNGSLDDVTERVRAQYQDVRILEPLRNLGFAGGCNLGIQATACSQGKSLRAYDHVALVNNDATVEAGWLRALVDVIEMGSDVGAASAKMLFADRFTGIDLEVFETSIAGGGDDRLVGVCVSGIRIDGERCDQRLQFDEGFHGPVGFDASRGEEFARWSKNRGALRISETRSDESVEQVVSFRLSAETERTVTLRSDIDEVTVNVGGGYADKKPIFTWVDVRVGADVFDVINNVGSNLYERGFGGDRGFLERDRGQFEQAVDVFAWCGGAVLLKKAYLDAVGMFDERLFLYYEDTDLSWRGRLQGWRYLYAPGALVRHRHAQSSGVGSDTFRFYTERNRLLVLVKNAPLWLAARSGLGEVRRTVIINVHHLILRPLTLRMPARPEAAMRRRVLKSYLLLVPAMLRDRWLMDRRCSRQSLMKWEVSK
jgi:GT2 family glycosyltransferase